MQLKPSFREFVMAGALLLFFVLCFLVLYRWGLTSNGVAWLSQIGGILVLVVVALWRREAIEPCRIENAYVKLAAEKDRLIAWQANQMREMQKRIHALEQKQEETENLRSRNSVD